MKSLYIPKIEEENLARFLSAVNMTNRDKEIVSLYLSKKPSYQELGETFQISGERIRQILEKFARKAHHLYLKSQTDL
jgi:DNA-directed RNA polymerase sigma subunit (sigma70/sigma32)